MVIENTQLNGTRTAKTTFWRLKRIETTVNKFVRNRQTEQNNIIGQQMLSERVSLSLCALWSVEKTLNRDSREQVSKKDNINMIHNVYIAHRSISVSRYTDKMLKTRHYCFTQRVMCVIFIKIDRILLSMIICCNTWAYMHSS